MYEEKYHDRSTTTYAIEKPYDVCVVGAGVVGSSTARYLASQGKRTLLLDQFPLPHWRGSSHGQTRIIRGSYNDLIYTKMVAEARKMWNEIEVKAGKEIYIKNVGMLTVEEMPAKDLREMENSLRGAGEKYEILTSKDLKERYPDLRFPSNYIGLLEHSAGILKADQCLRVLQDQFVEFGGTLNDGEKVLEILPGPPVTIKTSKHSFTADKLILTAGPWTNKLLKPLGIVLPLKVSLAVVLYWKILKSGAYSLSSGFPSFYSSGDLALYSIPAFEYPDMLKFGPTGDSKILGASPEIDPDSRDFSWRSAIETCIESSRNYTERHFPHLDHQSSAIVETCIYSITPDLGYVLDRHPDFPNIIIGAGFSAHGFKLGPVSGKILSQLAIGEQPSYDMSQFKMSRFKSVRLKAQL